MCIRAVNIHFGRWTILFHCLTQKLQTSALQDKTALSKRDNLRHLRKSFGLCVCVCDRTLHRHTQRTICPNVQCELSHKKFILLVFGLLKLTESAVVWYPGGLKRYPAFIVFKFWKSFSSVARSHAEDDCLLRHIRPSAGTRRHIWAIYWKALPLSDIG
jgi:hypothetical protein